MANKSVLELAVGTGQWDAGLRKAKQALDNFTQANGGLQEALENESKNMQKFVQMMGNMESTAKSVKGQMNEYRAVIEQLTMQYNRMSESQKVTIGQDYLQAIDQLRQKYQGLKKEQDEINSSLNSVGDSSNKTGSILDRLSDKFTINIDAVKLFGVGLQAAGAAMQVAKDAFFQSESNIDEWGRTVEGAKGAYSTFLNTLNSGNWSNFFTNLSTAVQGARDLYDALDRLGSIKANNQAAIAIVQQQIAQLRLAKQNGEDVDAQLKSATEQLRALQNQSVLAGQTAGNTSIRNTLRNRVNAANTTGVDIGEGTYIQLAYELEHSGQAVFDKMQKTFNDLAKKATVVSNDTRTNQYGGTSYSASTSIDLTMLTAEEQKQYLIAKAITEGETEIQQGLALYAQAVSEGTAAAREEFKGNRYALQGSSGSGKGGSTDKETYIPLAGSIDAQVAKVKELQEEFNKTADQSVRGKLLNTIDEATRHLNFMQGKGLEPLSREIGGSFSEHLGIQPFDPSKVKIEGKDLEALEELANAGDAASTSWGDALGAISGLGSALAGIEDPAVKVLGIIAEAIATVALTFAKSLKGTITPWDWIAGAAAGTATMIATIAAIKSATAGSYEQGGIVPGNSYSGDKLTANVNSGELILSMAQSDRVASLLRNGNNMQNMHLTATIKGTDIQLALNNTSRQQGRGTYVTAR